MKKYLAVSVATLAATALTTQSTAATTIASTSTIQQNQLNVTDPSKAVMSKDGKVTLVLKSNATTGYSWSLDKTGSDKDVKVLSHKYVAPTNGLMGAPGYEVWTLQLPKSMEKHPHKTKISMDYSQPWTKGSGSTTTFTVKTGHKK
jgi:predicted secreted protein